MPTLQNPLGNPIPAFTEHAISVSLPKWADNVGYEENDARVMDTMQTGYPRFFIHLNIRKVCTNQRWQWAAASRKIFSAHLLSSTALLHPRTKIWHTFREIATVPISQECRSMPHIPNRPRRLRPRRTTVHLRKPRRLSRALSREQVHHSQGVLATHRSRYLQPTCHSHPHHPRKLRLAPTITDAYQAVGTSALLCQTTLAPSLFR